MTRFEFRMPDPAEGLTEAELIEWHVETGDEVDEDGPLCDVETDKAVVEIPVPCPGTVEELLAEPGDVVAVGEVIAVFETDQPPRQQSVGAASAEPAPDASAAPAETGDGETAATGTNDEIAAAGSATTATETASTGDRVFAAPSTRRYAREQAVELSAIEGSGPNGRVLKDDVDRHLEAQSAPAPERPPAGGESAASAREEREVRRPLDGVRRRIAENMVRSKTTIPHVTSGFEADAAELVALKERLDAKHDGVRITYTPLLVKAIVPALQAFPIVNASVDDEANEIVEHRYYNVGVATHTEAGLMVPVIEDADRKSIVEIARELDELVAGARDRSIAPANLRGGTFTVTNVGSHGEHGTFGTPIINHPEAAILGVGRIRDKPVAVDENTVEVRKRVGLSLSYDHRIIDGVTASEFGEHVVESLEDTDVLLSRL